MLNPGPSPPRRVARQLSTRGENAHSSPGRRLPPVGSRRSLPVARRMFSHSVAVRMGDTARRKPAENQTTF